MIKKITYTLFLALLPFFASAQGFLHADGKNIVNGNGENIILRGIGTGNWMIQEGYMMQTGEVSAQHQFRAKLIEEIGLEKTDSFYNVWLDNHFTRADVDSMKAWGFNSVRPAMHYNLFTLPIEEEPVKGENTWLDKGFEMIDSLLDWCGDNEMYVILDMHGAPGGQGANAEISDYDPSKPSLWESEDNKDKLVALWRKIAERYSDEPWIGGYDLINETNWTLPGGTDLRNLFVDITTAIREVDTNHIVIIEGNDYGNNHTGLTPPWDDNLVYSGHKYWSPTGPNDMDWLIALRDEHNVPIWLGETGENGNAWYTDLITVLEDNNIGWSWWPVKKSANNCILFVETPSNYDTLAKVWRGDNAFKDVTLTADYTFKAVLDWAESHKIANCVVKYDVIDAMIRQPHTDETLPYTENKLTEPIFFSDYDFGKHDVAYADNDIAYYGGEWTAWNNGWGIRSDGVDIEAMPDTVTFEPSNGYNVGWTNDNEWMLYTLTADSTAAYTLEVSSASSNANGATFHLEVNGVVISDQFELPGTGSWQNWTTNTFEDIIIPEGEVKIKFYLNKGGSNLNYFNFINPKSTDDVEFRFMNAKTSTRGDSILIDLSKVITTTDADINTGEFELTINGESIDITGASVHSENNYILVLTHQESLYSDDELIITYNGTSINSNAKDLTPFSDKQVVNNLSIVHHIIPGKIQAEDFIENNGFSVVGCQDVGGGSKLGYTKPNYYTTYRVHVEETADYQINYRVATERSGTVVRFEVEDGDSFTSLTETTITSTGGWSKWETQSSNAIQLDEGYYNIRVYVKSGEYDLNWFELSAPTSTDKVKGFNDKYSLFPNPANEYTVLRVNELENNFITVTIYNLSGKVISQQQGTEKEFYIPTADMAKGMYFVTVNSNNENYSQKLVIQ